MVLEVERDAAGLSQMQQRLTDELVERLPDFGADVGFDGKALRSHSTGRRTARTGQPSDPDAAWGCHSYFSTDHTGREQKITKRWFGYKTHWLADVRYEIPINWTTRPANESEHRHSKALVEQYLNSPAGARCQTFVADRGLDDNPLRRMIHRSGGTAVIETRRMWQDPALPGEVHPTRALNADVIDHLIYDERGIVSCRCPQTGQIRQMAYHGVEKTRQTLKYHCPAAHYGFECLGRDQCYQDAGTPNSRCRVVRVKFDENNLRTIGTLPRNTYKWKRLYSARNALERINARSARDFNLHHHYIRGLGAMQLAVNLSLLTMQALTISAICAHQPARMRSLVRAAA